MKIHSELIDFLRNQKDLAVSLLFAAAVNIMLGFASIYAAPFIYRLYLNNNMLSILGFVMLFVNPLLSAYAGFILFAKTVKTANKTLSHFIYLPLVYAVNFFFVTIFIGYYKLSLAALKMLTENY